MSSDFSEVDLALDYQSTTDSIPKPMVPIGGIPIIEHIMNHYSNHGFKEFYLALGYKGDVIKKYFKNFKKIGI